MKYLSCVKYVINQIFLYFLVFKSADIHRLKFIFLILLNRMQLDHPNIVRIEEVYESSNEIYIVQELCLGGDLFDRLDEQPDFHYNEVQCARLVKQMLSSVRYLHSKGIIHRDLKLENFLFSSTKTESPIKMIDFGLSKHFEIGQSLDERVGTPYTVAPEILRGSYNEKCDVWAIGVITYLLLSGETPFGGLDGESLMLVRQQIMKAHVNFTPDDVWQTISDDGKNFVKLLLNPDPETRLSSKDAQLDPWIQVWAKKNAAEGNTLSNKTLTALMAFKESSDMQKLLSEVLAFTLLPEQIEELRDDFEKIDPEGDGEISLNSLKRVLMQNAEVGALGALTETEIEEIFDSIRVRKHEPTIRWHEFLAAGLSQARVDDRNLRLAFDRLDTEGKG
jgi:calcium-dependent protein kinase